MKLSEAIMLGSSVSDKPLCNFGFDTCLIGLGVAAFSTHSPTDSLAAIAEARLRWPWLTKPVLSFKRGSYFVTHLCDFVIAGRITLEQAVDRIRAVEPDETPKPVACEHLTVQNCEDQYGVLCGKKCAPDSYLCPVHLSEVGQ